MANNNWNLEQLLQRCNAKGLRYTISPAKGEAPAAGPQTPAVRTAPAVAARDTPGVWSFVYRGPSVSLNAFYVAAHWSKRHAIKNQVAAQLAPLLLASGLQPVHCFTLAVRYRSGLDCDNVSGIVKLLVDCLKGTYIPDDNAKHFTGLSITYDAALKYGTYHFTITEILP